VEALRRVRVARWVMLYLLVMAWALATGKCMGGQITSAWGLGRYLDLSPLLHPALWLGTGAAYLAAAVAFTFSVRERLTGALLFAWLGVVASAEMCVRDAFMPALDILLAANMTLAWVLGLGGAGDAAAREARGHEWMCGVFGAMISLSGLSKVLNAGAGWFNGEMHSLYIWERAQPMVDLEALRALRLFFADHPALCAAGATWTIAVECLGITFAIPRLRKIYAVMVASMFVSMDIALGFGEPGWVQLPLALAFSSLAVKRP
jgi:hypothetical protein